MENMDWTVHWTGRAEPSVTEHCRKPSHLRTKIKSFIIFQIQEALWRNFNNLKPSFSRIKSFTFRREVKEKARASEGK